MDFDGTVTLNAPIANAWKVINDVDVFAACMPGVEEVRQIDDRTFEGSIGANVGPVSGKFAFTARIVDAVPPQRMTAMVEGTDSVTRSTMVSEVRLTLEETGALETALAYHTTVDVKGRLAILGDMVLRAAAAVMLEEFTKRLKSAVERPSTPSTGSGFG